MEKNDIEFILNNSFQKLLDSNSLTQIRLDIEKILISFIQDLKSTSKEEQRIFDNIESRIKTMDSFREKIKRKNYIATWNLTDNDETYVTNYICKNLTDLIGFRINCFFLKDEVYIYTKFRDFYNNKKFSKDLILNFNENTKQNNGHTIYKFSGIYKDTYSFEVQIKSIMHNVWGEVEHKTVYKNKTYDAGIIPKKDFLGEVFNILVASDKQLVSLFSENITTPKLIHALFFQLTNTKLLAKYYDIFFKIFTDNFYEKQIKEYIASFLLEKPYIVKTVDQTILEPQLLEIKKIILEIDPSGKRKDYTYTFVCLFEIAKSIWKFQNFEEFCNFSFNAIFLQYKKSNELYSTDDNNPFSDDDDNNECDFENKNTDIMTLNQNVIINLIKDILEG